MGLHGEEGSDYLVIEWSDGKAQFDPDEVALRIAQSFEAALAVDGVHGEPSNPSAGV